MIADEPPTRKPQPEPRAATESPPAAADEPIPPKPPADGPGYADATLTAGRPRSHLLHVGALLLAAGADIGAFHQVISRVLDANDALVALVVAGFTALVVYLGHVIGVLLRNGRARLRTTSTSAVAVCLLVLAALGGLAFLVRLNVHVPQAGTRTYSAGAAAAPAVVTDPNRDLYAALVFLGLFVATATVAAVGAYLTHNPYRESYATAVRAYRRWAAVVAVEHATHLVEVHRAAEAQEARAASDRIAEAQKRRILAIAEGFKHRARVRLLAAARDPAVSDAWTDEDARPYDFAHGRRPDATDRPEGS